MILTVMAIFALAAAPSELSQSDRTKAFLAAGFKFERKQWRSCGDPGTLSYGPVRIEEVRDLNRDGLPEAVITENSAYCFGQTGTGFALASKQTSGEWKLVFSSPGVATFLATARVGGWPDLQVGGPGFCFPVYRWNGKSYQLHRHAYQGKSCRAG